MFKPGQGPEAYARHRLQQAMRAGLMDPNTQITDPAALWRQESGNIVQQLMGRGAGSPLQALRGMSRPQAPGVPQMAQRGAPQRPSANQYAQNMLGRFAQVAPQLGDEFMGMMHPMAQQSAPPQQQYRDMSKIFAQKAQEAGYMDPRKYLMMLLARRRG